MVLFLILDTCLHLIVPNVIISLWYRKGGTGKILFHNSTDYKKCVFLKIGNHNSPPTNTTCGKPVLQIIISAQVGLKKLFDLPSSPAPPSPSVISLWLYHHHHVNDSRESSVYRVVCRLPLALLSCHIFWASRSIAMETNKPD